MLYDVSSVTDTLLALVSSAWSTAPLWQELGTGVSFQPTFTGLAPDAMRQQAGPQLSMCLYHVEQDPAREAQFWTAAAQSVPHSPPISFQPLALDLFYLLSAYSQGSYIEEQQAMSIALRIFHANPIVRGGTGGQAWELTLTMEHRSYDELSPAVAGDNRADPIGCGVPGRGGVRRARRRACGGHRAHHGRAERRAGRAGADADGRSARRAGDRAGDGHRAARRGQHVSATAARRGRRRDKTADPAGPAGPAPQPEPAEQPGRADSRDLTGPGNLVGLPGLHDLPGLPELAEGGASWPGQASRRPAWLADVRLRALRRVAWLRECWSRGGYGDESAMAISHSEVDRALAPPAALAGEEQAFYRRDPIARPLSAALDSLADRPGRRRAVAASGDLPAPHGARSQPAGTRARRRGHPGAAASVRLPAGRDRRIGCDPWPGRLPVVLARQRRPRQAEALRRWNLARPAHPGSWPGSVQCEWQADPAVLGYLLRDPAADQDPASGDGARLLRPPDGAPVLAAAQLSDLVTFLTAMQDGAAGGARMPVEVEITGPAGAGRTVLAAQAAAAVGLPLLALDAEILVGGDVLAAATGLARAARLSDAAVIWRDADALDPAVLAAVSGLAPVAFLTTGTQRQARTDGRVVRWTVTMPPLDRASRLRLWPAVGGPGPAPEPVAEWPLRPAEIAAVARAAPAGSTAAGKVARSLLLPTGQEQITSLPLPYDWPNLVVSAQVGEHLSEIAEQARARGQVLDDWGLRRLTPMGGGLTALFAGPSGTGKTMAAQVLARSLGLELFSVDLAGVVSKYIGETEKQLRILFDACERAPAVLFFDEADALFGRRTQVSDAHDRFANIEIDYLLQRMERFNGLAVLASNRKGDLDEAFIRRLRFIVELRPAGPGRAGAALAACPGQQRRPGAAVAHRRA